MEMGEGWNGDGDGFGGEEGLRRVECEMGLLMGVGGQRMGSGTATGTANAKRTMETIALGSSTGRANHKSPSEQASEAAQRVGADLFRFVSHPHLSHSQCASYPHIILLYHTHNGDARSTAEAPCASPRG
jgi:hypothetical protein